MSNTVFLLDPTTGERYRAGTAQKSYTLQNGGTLAGSTATAQITGVQGGSYIWAYQFGGTTPSLKLQTLGPDGTNWMDVGSAVTASGQTSVVIGNNATVRLLNNTAGAITNLYSTLT